MFVSKKNRRVLGAGAALLTGVFAPLGAFAQSFVATLEIRGAPPPGAMHMQAGVTRLAQDIRALDTFLMILMLIVTLFVTALLIWTMVKHNAKANPNPANFTHNTRIEIAWTLVPLLILVVIGAFSLPVLFRQQTIPEADVLIKVTGYQWHWTGP